MSDIVAETRAPDEVKIPERPERASSVKSTDSHSSKSARKETNDSPRNSDRDSNRRRRRDDDDDRDRRSHRSDRNSSRERRNDRDNYRSSSRRRSRSGDRDSHRDRRSRDNRDSRNYDDDRSRRRDSPSYDNRAQDPPPKRRSPSPQLSEEQREMRSVFVSQLSARVTDRELSNFFERQAGKVREAKVITDRISRRSKGVGYVEFVDMDTVSKALGLSGTKLLGIPIVVAYTEAEKNRQARDGMGPAQSAGLYVGSLNFALTESDIRQVFQPFGVVDLVDLHKDPITGKSKGFAFVQFKDPKDAMQALDKMNNFNLAGREIKVGLVAEKAAPSYAGRPDPVSLDEGGGANFNNISRIELMQKLSRSDRSLIDLPKAPMMRPNIPQATSRNILLKDAFNPEDETERDWDIELRDDVKSEAESKYGKVIEIFVVKESQGEIYIRFDSVEAATSAVAGLNGRWFGGRQIGCNFVGDSIFEIAKV